MERLPLNNSLKPTEPTEPPTDYQAVSIYGTCPKCGKGGFVNVKSGCCVECKMGRQKYVQQSGSENKEGKGNEDSKEVNATSVASPKPNKKNKEQVREQTISL